jgi:dihydropteroate synthase
MGVVNITPDSFSDGGLYLAPEAAVSHGLQLLEEGADLLDLGAESTRPGSRTGGATDLSQAAVSAEEELARLLPVLKGILKARPDAIISVDTYKASTARAALNAGAEVVNDVSGFTWDKEIASVCRELGAGVILMHTRGRPDEWSSQPQLAPDALLSLVRAGLVASLASALEAGISPEAVVLDPGYGFGKRFGENYALLARQAELLTLGRPLAVGVSRKSFLRSTMAELYGENASAELLFEARERAGLAAMTAAILSGASIVRVHTVREAVEAAKVTDALLAAEPQKSAQRTRKGEAPEVRDFGGFPAIPGCPDSLGEGFSSLPGKNELE